MVEQITSYEVYKNLIKEAPLWNNGFTPGMIKKYIVEKRLYAYIFENTLLLLYDEGEFYQIIVGGKLNDFPSNWNQNLEKKPMVSFVVEEKQQNVELKTFLLHNGFSYRCFSQEYVCMNFHEFRDTRNLLYIETQTGNEQDYYQIIHLWKEYLPKIEVSVITCADLKELHKKGELLYIKNKHGVVMAACYFDFFLGTSTIHHLCVIPECRGHGYAVKLIQTWLEKMRELNGRKARAWIEQTNISSQKAFEKAGFVTGRTVSHQYVLDMEERKWKN